jgi:GT2 family glycosyltransferase
MKVALCIPTLNAFDNLIVCINSARSGSLVPDRIFVWDNSGGRLAQYLDIRYPDFDLTNTLIVSSHTNMGCSKTWNTMIAALPDYLCIVSNDDIIFHIDTIQKLAEEAEQNPNHIVYCAGGIPSPNAFSLFATDARRMEIVGWFDEFFKYPYCEDGDMYRRIRLMGDDLVRVEGCGADHAGSQTLENYNNDERSQHHIRFQRNTEYFRLKWNVKDHNDLLGEGYTMQFNNDPIQQTLVESYIIAKYGH